MDAVNEQTMKHYLSFVLLADTLKELHSNVDESGIPLDLKGSNVVAVKETKRVRYRSSGR